MNHHSAGVADFLACLRAADEMYRIATDDEQRANDETQDILHSIELDRHDYHEMARLGKKLREVRKRRREAKETQEVLLPVVDWADQNKQVIKTLERVLGEVRKAEKRQECRIYAPRTDILEDSGETRVNKNEGE